MGFGKKCALQILGVSRDHHAESSYGGVLLYVLRFGRRFKRQLDEGNCESKLSARQWGVNLCGEALNGSQGPLPDLVAALLFSHKNLLVGLFSLGCFLGLLRGKAAHSGIWGNSSLREENVNLIRRGNSLLRLIGCFLGHPSWWKTAPLKRAPARGP